MRENIILHGRDISFILSLSLSYMLSLYYIQSAGRIFLFFFYFCIYPLTLLRSFSDYMDIVMLCYVIYMHDSPPHLQRKYGFEISKITHMRQRYYMYIVKDMSCWIKWEWCRGIGNGTNNERKRDGKWSV